MFNNKNEDKGNRIELPIEQQEKKEILFKGSLTKVPGHIMWEFDILNGELRRAKYKEEKTMVIDFLISEKDELKLTPDLIKKRKRIATKETCIYFQALNLKNAIKKLKKNGVLTIIPIKEENG